MKGSVPIWVTSIADRLDHTVTLEAMASARATGRPVATCGVDLVPAALSAPPGRRCRRCVELPAQLHADQPGGGRHARPNAWRWLRERTRHS